MNNNNSNHNLLRIIAHHIWAKAYVVLPIITGLVLSCGYIPYQRDDAFIAYRFASIFSESGRIAFNQSGPWVEGFSSPIWFMLLSIISKFTNADILPTASMSMGFLSFFALLMTATVMSKSDKISALHYSQLQTFFVIGLLATLPAASYYSTTGLETLLFALVVLCYAGAIARLLPMAIGITAGLCAVWVRPEGPWLIVAGVMQLLVLRDKTEKISSLITKKNLLLVFAPLTGLLFLTFTRWSLFNSLLPNTYWAKEPELIAGLEYVMQQYTTLWYGLLILCAVLGGFLGGRIFLSFMVAGLTWIIAAIIEGGDWMPLGRMLLSANILFAFASGGIFNYLPNRFPVVKSTPTLKVILIPLLVILSANLYAITTITRESHNTLITSQLDSLAVVKWLQNEKLQSVGLVDIGKIGFWTGIEVFDFAGLTDPVIAKAPGKLLDKRFDLDYLFKKRRPEALVFRLLKPFEGGILNSSAVEVRIMQDERFIEQYAIAKKILPDYLREPYYGLLLFRRKDL